MTALSRAARATASALITGALLVGATGCSFITPTATLNKYDPSDGISADLGEVKVLNVLAVSDEENSSVNLMVTVVNNGSSRGTLRMQYVSESGERIDITKPITPNEVARYGTAVDDETIVISDADIKAGDLLPIYFQFGDASGEEMLIPVIPSDNPIYSDLAPES